MLKKKLQKKIEKKQLRKGSSKSQGKKLLLHEIIEYPLISEKAVGMIETQNKLTFIVNKNATKPEIKKTIEEMYNIKISEIKTIKDQKNRKKAIIRLDAKYKAGDLATKLGII